MGFFSLLPSKDKPALQGRVLGFRVLGILGFGVRVWGVGF